MVGAMVVAKVKAMVVVTAVAAMVVATRGRRRGEGDGGGGEGEGEGGGGEGEATRAAVKAVMLAAAVVVRNEGVRSHHLVVNWHAACSITQPMLPMLAHPLAIAFIRRSHHWLMKHGGDGDGDSGGEGGGADPHQCASSR